MANEVRIIELRSPRMSNAPLREMPPIAAQNVDVGGDVSAAFNGSTTNVMIRTTTDCTLEFGPNPDGSGITIALKAAEGWHDFGVSAGHKVRVV